MRARKLILVTTIGTALEFYDFVIYALLVPIMAPLFFPTSDPMLSMIAGYGAFATGSLMRPIGALYFGSIGDKYGRQKALMISLILMGLSTLGLGLLPTYDTLGIWAPIGIVLLRLVQGFSAGGEYSGGALLLIENRPKSMAYRSGTIICMSVLFSMVVGNEVAKIFTSPEMPVWAWRIPLILGAVAAAVGYILRRQTTEFQKPAPRVSQAAEKLPLRDLFRRQGFEMLALVFITGLGIMIYYTFIVYIVAFMKTQQGWTSGEAYNLALTITVEAIFFLYVVGWAADKWQIGLKILKAGALCFVFGAVPLFYLFTYGDTFWIYMATPVIAAMFALYGALHNTFNAKLFPQGIRYRGMAISYSLAAVLIGSTSPMVYSILLKVTGNPMSPGYYLTLIALIAWGFLEAFDRRRLGQIPL